MTDWRTNLPPGTIPGDLEDRERDDQEDDLWRREWWNQQEPEDKEL